MILVVEGMIPQLGGRRRGCQEGGIMGENRNVEKMGELEVGIVASDQCVFAEQMLATDWLANSEHHNI